MEKLPLEITENILFRLPVVSQLQCRELCKTWQTMLPKPSKGLLYGVSRRRNTATEYETEFYFSEEKSDKVVNTTKLDHSFKMPTSIYEGFMVGSCNGLVCYAGYRKLTDQYGTEVHVCNPVNGEHIQLPTVKWINALWTSRTIGFGYVPSSKEYKVVSIQCGLFNQDRKVVQVYTLLQGGGDTGWRNITSTIKKGLMSQCNDFSSSPGVFIRGVLHWLDESNRKANILAFDLEHETFELLPSVPPDDVCDSDVAYCFELMELGGNLCVLLSDPNKDIIIWELRQRKIVKHGPYWRRKFTLAWEDYSWFGSSLLTKCNVILSCYDPETRTLRNLEETLKKFKDEASVYATTRATPHVNSLVSLKALTEKKGRKKRKAHEESEKEKLWLPRKAQVSYMQLLFLFSYLLN